MKVCAKQIEHTWNPDLRITSMQVRDDWTLDLHYNNQAHVLFDFKPRLKKPWFKRLNDIDWFRQAKVDMDFVYWPDGTDIAPEALYEEGTFL